MCAPSLGMCVPSFCMWAPSLGMCAPSPCGPLQKAMSVSNYPPYLCVLLSFCLSLPCGIVGCAHTWHVRAVTCAHPHLAWARPHLCASSLCMCAPSPSVPLQKAMSVSNYPPYPCVLLSFCLSLPCGIVGCAHTWHVRAFTWHVRAVTCARPHLACAHPHLAWARPHLCAPSLCMCAPSFVHALTWHVRTLSIRPSPKSNVGVQLRPLSMIIVVFLCSVTLWDSWVRPHLACARPPLACARPHFACGHPHLACARPLRASLSKKQCRCPTTPLIRVYCCLFAFRYLAG
jgi:hypothetical protein